MGRNDFCWPFVTLANGACLRGTRTDGSQFLVRYGFHRMTAGLTTLKRESMKKLFLVASIAVLGGGCASTSDPSATPKIERQPASDPVPSIAAPVAADDLAMVRDPRSPLSKRLVLFDFDSYAIKSEYAELLQAHGKFVGSKPAVKIVIQGSTDERGSREYNLALGQRRAEAVRRRLEMLGAGSGQIEAVSFGEERPRAPGNSEASWEQNRNAAIAYPGEY